MRLRQIFAENLRRIRDERELSQEDLAELAGIDRTYVSALERQRYNASIEVIEKLAKALKVEAYELLLR